MITPTGVTYSAYWDAIKAGNPTHVRMTFTNQGIMLEDGDIDIVGGLVLTDMFNGDTDLIFGKAVCKELKLSILNTSKLNGLIWTGEFKFEMGVEISSVTKWVTIGYFTGEKPKNITSVETIDFTAYDRMIRFDQLADTFVDSLVYPKTVSDIYDELCAYVGLQNEAGDELANIMSRSYASAPADIKGYTCRDILKWIAEACGCYATINEDGNVQLLWFTDNTAHAVTGNEEFHVESADVNTGMIWDEADTYTWDEIETFTWNDLSGYMEEYSVERIVIKQLDNDLDIIYPDTVINGNTYMIVENPFLSVGTYAEVATYIKPLFDRLATFGGYLPVNLNCIGNWCVEAGDVITIDVNSYTITFPIFVKTMRWNGSVTDEYETTGNSVREPYASKAQKEQVLNNQEIKMYVKGKYYGIQSGIDITEEGVTISGGKFIKIESGGKFIITSDNFTIDENGDVTINGNGTLAGKIKIGNAEFAMYDEMSPGISVGIYAKEAPEPTAPSIPTAGGIHMKAQRKFFSGTVTDAWLNFDYIDSAMSLYSDSSLTLGRKSVPFYRVYANRVISGDNELYLYAINGSNLLGGLRLNYDNSRNLLIKPHGLSGNTFDPPNSTSLGEYTSDFTRIYGTSIYYEYLIQNSSRDIKHDIKPLESVGEMLDSLKPVTFVYDRDPDEHTRMGLIYEDTIEIMPEICTNDESNKAINYVELIPALLKEIQSLRCRVKELEEREA